MNWEVFITCAITGAGRPRDRSATRCRSRPEQIADSAVEAARAGAAVVHIHVRDPADRQGLARPRALPPGGRADPLAPTSTWSST